MKEIGRNPIPQSALEQRRHFEVELHRSGMSKATITKKVNELSDKNGWGEVSIRTVQRDIDSFYANEMVYSGRRDILQARTQRAACIAQIEATIELLRLEIAERDKSGSWGSNPLARVKAIKEMCRMQIKLAELQGWAMGKIPNTFTSDNLSSEGNPLTMFEQAQRDFQENPETKDLVLEMLDVAQERMEAKQKQREKD